MPISQVEQVPVGELRLNPANVRKHSEKQISQLAEIIRQVGFLVPIIADEKRVVQAGNGRLLAAREIGLRSVPVITASGLSDAKRRAYVVADNKIAQGAGWDRSALAAELHELARPKRFELLTPRFVVQKYPFAALFKCTPQCDESASYPLF